MGQRHFLLRDLLLRRCHGRRACGRHQGRRDHRRRGCRRRARLGRRAGGRGRGGRGVDGQNARPHLKAVVSGAVHPIRRHLEALRKLLGIAGVNVIPAHSFARIAGQAVLQHLQGFTRHQVVRAGGKGRVCLALRLGRIAHNDQRRARVDGKSAVFHSDAVIGGNVLIVLVQHPELARGAADGITAGLYVLAALAGQRFARGECHGVAGHQFVAVIELAVVHGRNLGRIGKFCRVAFSICFLRVAQHDLQLPGKDLQRNGNILIFRHQLVVLAHLAGGPVVHLEVAEPIFVFGHRAHTRGFRQLLAVHQRQAVLFGDQAALAGVAQGRADDIAQVVLCIPVQDAGHTVVNVIPHIGAHQPDGPGCYGQGDIAALGRLLAAHHGGDPDGAAVAHMGHLGLAGQGLVAPLHLFLVLPFHRAHRLVAVAQCGVKGDGVSVVHLFQGAVPGQALNIVLRLALAPQGGQRVGNGGIPGVHPHLIHAGAGAGEYLVVAAAALPAHKIKAVLFGRLGEGDHAVAPAQVAVVVQGRLLFHPVHHEFHGDVHRLGGDLELTETVVRAVLEPVVFKHHAGALGSGGGAGGAARIQHVINARAVFAQLSRIGSPAVLKAAGAGIARGHAHIKVRAVLLVSAVIRVQGFARREGLQRAAAGAVGGVIHRHIGTGIRAQAEIIAALGNGDGVIGHIRFSPVHTKPLAGVRDHGAARVHCHKRGI